MHVCTLIDLSHFAPYNLRMKANGINKAELLLRLKRLTVFAPLRNSGLFKNLEVSLSSADEGARTEAAANIFIELAKEGCTDDLSGYIIKLALNSRNLLSDCCSNGARPGRLITEAAKYDIETINTAASLVPADLDLPVAPPDFGNRGKKLTYRQAAAHYKKYGAGPLFSSKAFFFRDGGLVPIEYTSKIQLDDLKEYGEQKARLIYNTECFLSGLPAHSVLLYGDRGTGKSSSVHALLNKYAHEGLRLIQLNKSDINNIHEVLGLIYDCPLHFIIFIDDLTFSGGSDEFAALKACIEGSIAKSSNVLIYATSNRRHLIKESFSERVGDDLHLSDTIEEQMSLSDRFGLVLTYLNPDRDEYTSILKQILSGRNIDIDDGTAMTLAEKFALKKGGRSPRSARQLADLIEASLARSGKIDPDLF